MLYSERKRLADLSARESLGESLWTLIVPPAFRQKLLRTINFYGLVVDGLADASFESGSNRILAHAQGAILEDTGRNTLTGRPAASDMQAHIISGSEDDFPDILEASSRAIGFLLRNSVEGSATVKNFETELNMLLESYRIAYSIEGGEVIAFKSRELHISVVLPTLRLLTQEGWEAVEKSYQDSLKELTAGKPDNAITDATTALQEALRKAGCKGGNFADLVKSAKSTVLKGYDAKYIEGLEQLIGWASAMRSNMGDSHKVAEAEKDDAWFVIHLVGVLLLRLSRIK